MEKKWKAVLLLVVILAVLGGVKLIGEEPINETKHIRAEEGLIKVGANPDKGFYWPYYLSVPALSVPEDQFFYLLVCPNNTGTGSDDYKVHDDAAFKQISRGFCYQISRDVGVPLLVPVFPRPYKEWWLYTQALNRETMQVETGPLERIDLQLIEMIRDAQEKLEDMGLNMEENVFMSGYSAGGFFSNRFAMLHPHIVRAVASGGLSGIPILPIEKLGSENLNYPVGISDIEQIAGIVFDYDRYIKVAQYIYMGSEDTNDATHFDEGFSRSYANQIWRLIGKEMDMRWKKSQEIYRKQGISAQLVTYEGMGHILNIKARRDVINFFKNIDD